MLSTSQRFAVVLSATSVKDAIYWTGQHDALGAPEGTRIIAAAQDYGSRDEARTAAAAAGLMGFSIRPFTHTTRAAE